MATLFHLSEVFLLEQLINRTPGFSLCRLPKSIRQRLAQLRFESSPPAEWKKHFQVLNLLPFDFRWSECTSRFDSFKFSSQSYQYDDAEVYSHIGKYERLRNMYFESCNNEIVSRTKYTVRFFRAEEPFLIRGYEIENRVNYDINVRDFSGPALLPTRPGELQFFWQKGSLQRGFGVIYRALWPIRMGRELYLLNIEYHECDFGRIHDPIYHEISIELRPDPKVTRQIDALILTPLARPKLMFH